MQIGNSDLDKIFTDVFAPALRNSGLDPKRVDKHNEGRLLKSEIVNFISESDIIIADLTNERPNCYLEIGYAMGLDKFRNLILTAREDHHHDSPNYVKGGPKIHFDLSGYDILFWNPENLFDFREELEKRIKRRLVTLPSPLSQEAVFAHKWDEEWITKNREIAMIGLKKTGNSGYMEITMALRDSKLNESQTHLLQSARASEINTFGWPIGVVMTNVEEFRPKPKADGIVAEILTEDKTYDYWALRKDGSYYFLHSLFEDSRVENRIFFNTRIVRITEALLHAVRLYTSLNVQPDSRLLIGFRHGGLRGRLIGSTPNRLVMRSGRGAVEDEVSTEIETAIEKIEANLTDLVEQITTPLFVVFDFFEVQKSILEEIVNNFVNGKVT